MKKDNIRKNIKKIMIFLIILVVIIMMIIGVLKLIYRNKEREAVYVRPDTINPMFSENFFKKYKGDVSKEDILNRLTDFIYYIIDNKQELTKMNEQELSQKYNKDEKYLKTIGFASLEDFLRIIAIIQRIDSDELNFSYASFEINTIENLKDKFCVNLSLKFVDTNEIVLKLQVEKKAQEEIIHISY